MIRFSIAMEFRNGAFTIMKFRDALLLNVHNALDNTSTWLSKDELSELQAMIGNFLSNLDVSEDESE